MGLGLGLGSGLESGLGLGLGLEGSCHLRPGESLSLVRSSGSLSPSGQLSSDLRGCSRRSTW